MLLQFSSLCIYFFECVRLRHSVCVSDTQCDCCVIELIMFVFDMYCYSRDTDQVVIRLL